MHDNGDPALTDYGLAKFWDDFSASISGEGTIHYCAPELIAGKQRTIASDVWALGGVLFAVRRFITCWTSSLTFAKDVYREESLSRVQASFNILRDQERATPETEPEGPRFPYE